MAGGLIALTIRRHRIHRSVKTRALPTAQLPVNSKLLRVVDLKP
jgi:hypothetical protein